MATGELVPPLLNLRWTMDQNPPPAELRANDLVKQKETLIAYLISKVKAHDWHAVQDAASDIRELEARINEITERH